MIKLEFYRNKAGLSQYELAEKLNMTQQRISAYELGKRQPDLDTLKLFADFFGITVDELLGINNEEKIEKDKKFIAFYNGYKDMDSADQKMLDDIFNSIVERNKNKKKGD